MIAAAVVTTLISGTLFTTPVVARVAYVALAILRLVCVEVSGAAIRKPHV